MIVKYFLTNSVETRTDPDQLVCHKPASLDLCCFKTIYLRRTLKMGECCQGVLVQEKCDVKILR